MTKKRCGSLWQLVLVILFLNLAGNASVAEQHEKLRVYILAGQSNMVGMANIDTLGYIADDPATAGMLQDMLNPDGTPRSVENVWISNYQSNVPNDPAGEAFGPLTAGYGGRSNPAELGQNIGPEFSFGIYIQKLVNAPVLIIKAAWGGKSLYMDFRPPSAGPFGLSEADVQRIKERGGDLDAERAKRAEGSGVYYRLMMTHVRNVLRDIARVYPGYDEQRGYELCGFVWFQGWNDMVNSGVYPRRGQPGGYDEYSRLLTLFIRDVRKDLGVPNLPFVIGVMGVNGPIENVSERYRAVHGSFREAMAAPAALDEFKGNVAAVRTAPFWELKLDALIQKRDAYNGRVKQLKNQEQKGEITADTLAAELKDIESEALSQEEAEILKRGASNAAYHYLGCGKTMALIGKAFAEAVFGLQEN